MEQPFHFLLYFLAALWITGDSDAVALTSGSCYEEPSSGTPSLVAAGNVFLPITAAACTSACADLSFMYAATDSNVTCLCGNVAAEAALTLATVGNCSSPGVANGFYTVYAAGASFSNLTATFVASGTNSETVTITASVDIAAGVNITYEYGDGSLVTPNNKYTYLSPGTYSITVKATDGSKLLFTILSHTFTVPGKALQALCPALAAVGDEHACQAVITGASSSLSVSFPSAATYTAPDPSWDLYGLMPPTDTNATPSTSTATTILSSNYVKRYGIAQNIAFWAASTGSYQFVVSTPVCASGTFCLQDGKCHASCTASTEQTCSASQYLCTGVSSIGGCAADSDTSCPSGGTLPTSFTTITTVPLTVTSTGPQYFSILSTATVWLDPGNFVGVKAPSASSLGVIAGTPADYEDGAAGSNQAYMMLSASPVANLSFNSTCTDLSTSSFSYTMDTTLTNSTLCQSPVVLNEVIISTNISLSPTLIVLPTENSTTFTISFFKGGPVYVEVDYGDGMKAPENLTGPVDITTPLTKTYTYVVAGSYVVNVTAWNEYSQLIGITNNTRLINVLVQVPVLPTWTLVPDKVDFFLTTENASFQLTGPVLNYPTDSAVYVDWNDGTSPTNVTLESYGPPSSTNYTLTHAYPKVGVFDINGSISNWVSSQSFNATVTILAFIKNLTATLKYVTPSGAISLPMGVNRDQVPTNYDSTFTLNVLDGTVEHYLVYNTTSGTPELLDNYTVPDMFSPNNLTYSFNFTSEGNQTFLWSACNNLQPYGVNYTIAFTVVGKVRNPVIDDFFIVTSQYLNKTFKITFDSVGSGTCMKFDYGDGHVESYGEKWQCDIKYPTLQYMGVLVSPLTVRHNYTKRANYNATLVAVGMDVEVDYVLPFVVAPDASCVPPLTYIPVNNTDFEAPRIETRSSVVEFTGSGIINCSRTQNTLKEWFIYTVNDTSGKDLRPVDISSLVSRSFATLIIPSNFLVYGLYKVMYKLTMSDPVLDPTFPLTRWASTYLKIEPSPLVGIMIAGGGSKIVRGGNQTVRLQPSVFSYDPDYPDDKNFNITWFCRQTAPISESLSIYDDGYFVASGLGSFGGGCYGYAAGALNYRRLEFVDGANKFVAFDITYQLTALINKDTRYTRAVIDVSVLPNPVPIVTIACLNSLLCKVGSDATYINPTSRLAVTGSCSDYCVSSAPAFLWTADKLDDAGVLTSLSQELIANSAGITTAELALQPAMFDSLNDTDTLVLGLNVTDPGSPVPGQTQFYLKKNQVPTDGSCKSNVSTLRSLVDQLTVDCSNWIDPESKGISKYNVYAVDNDTGAKQALTSGTLFPMAIILNPGTQTLSVDIVDTWGAIAVFNITPSITVTTPTEAEYKAFVASGALQQMSGAGNSDLLLMAMQAQITVQAEAPWSAVALTSNMTETQRNDALLNLAAQKQEQLDLLQSSMSFSTVQQLNAGSGTLASILSGTKAEGDEALALDMGVRQSALNVLEAMANGASKIQAATPDELVPFVGQMASAMGSLMEGVTNVVGSNDPNHLPPGDLAKGDTMFYDTDVGEDLYMQVPKDPNLQMRGNILDSTKQQAGAIIPSLMRIAGQLEHTLLSLMVVPEGLQISSENNVTLTAQLYAANALEGAVTLGAANASITFPPGFCPYVNKTVNGSCTEPIAVAASCWPALGHSFVKTSDLVSKDTFTLDINLLDRNLSKLVVENANPPVILNIPRRENSVSRLENATTVDVTKAMQDAVVPIAYSLFLVERPNMTITIEVTPGKPNQTLVLLLSRERMPTLNKADYIIFVPQLNQTSNGTYTWKLALAGSENKTGRWFVGILEVKVPSYPAMPLSAISSGTQVNPLGSLTVASLSANYGLRVFTSGCFFFNETDNSWTSNGLNVVNAGMLSTGCSSSHLSIFGSGFFVKPNTVDFSYVFAHASFTDNITIYVTIIVTFTIYVSLLIWSRYQDKKDVETLGATPLPDNRPEDKYVYEILVQTGDQADAATDSKVQFIVTGDDEDSGARTFGDSERKIFRKGQTNSFVMACPRPLGNLMYLRIWHDNSGKGRYASWYLSFIVIRDVQTQEKHIFIADNWFAVEEEDGKIDRLLPVAGKAQMTDFKHLFSKTSSNKLRDGHLWFSVFLRPPRSRFTRVERLSSCMALLYLSMLVNAMWYGTVPPSQGRSFSLGPVKLTAQQFFVGLASNLIVFPPSFIIVLLFRKSQPRKLRPSRIDKALVKSGSVLTKSQMMDEFRKEEKVKKKRKKTFLLPWWCRYIAWILVVASIGVSIFFLWAYGIQFGNEKTTQWLTSLVISFFTSVLLVQPIKVVIAALFISMVCPSLNSDIDDADLDEEDPSLTADEEVLHGSRHFRNGRQRARYSPFDQAFIERLREVRLKELKMWDLLRQILSYVIFLSVLLLLAYDNRDSNSHLQHQNVYNAFVVRPGFDKVQTTNDWWKWANNTLLTEMQAPFWYNGKSPYGQRGFLRDRVNRVLGYAFLRQIRVLPNTCRVQPVMKKVSESCSEFASIVNEDNNNYCSYWVPSSMKVKTTPKPGDPFNILYAANCSAKEFKYKKSSEIGELPLVGRLDAYTGSGYILKLSGASTTVSRTMNQALQANWIDQRTRAVIFHFSTYNVQVNLFSVITLMAEFAPSGNIVPSWTIDVIRLIHTDGSLVVRVCQFVYMCFIIYFTVREIMKMCKQKKGYFRKYWSYGEWCIILSSYAGMVLYILRYMSTMEALDEFEKTWGNGYINLRYVDSLDAVYSYLMAIVCFLSILKVLQLLNFNPRMLLLEDTLRYAAEDLLGYFIMFFVIFFAFTQLFYLLLCNNMRKFSTLWSATKYTLCLALGVFDYQSTVQESRLIPYIYTIFSFCIVHVLINVLFTIIMAAFQTAHANSEKRAQDLDFVSYLASRIKSAMGLLGKNNRVTPKAILPPNKSVKDLPIKVDQFVAYINSLYFNGQLDTGPPPPAVGGSRNRY